jgi:hypothetical protein
VVLPPLVPGEDPFGVPVPPEPIETKKVESGFISVDDDITPPAPPPPSPPPPPAAISKY